MSWLRYMTLWSFRKLNPSWKMELFVAGTKEVENYWKGHNKLDFCEYKGEDYFSRLAELDIEIKDCELDNVVYYIEIGPPHLCDMCEWAELSCDGGIYCDMDVLWIKSIDSFYEEIQSYDVCITYDSYFSIGLVASSGNNRFFGDVFERSLDTFTRENYQSAGVVSLYSLASRRWMREMHMLDLFKILAKQYSDLSFFNIPREVVNLQLHDAGDCFNNLHTKLPEGCIGIHWYGGNPVAQEWNNKLNEDNVHKFGRYGADMTVSYHASKLIKQFALERSSSDT